MDKTPDKIVEESKIKNGEFLDEESDIVLQKSKKKFLVDTMFPRANKSERKLLSETLRKIFIIIQKSTDRKTSENIIDKIKEELK